MKELQNYNLNLQPVGYVNEVKVSYRKKRVSKKTYSNHHEAANLFRKIWEDDIDFRERVYIAYFDRAYHLLGVFQLSSGNQSQSTFDPTMIIQMAFLVHSKSFIICHNHPSGNLKPSGHDIKATKDLAFKAEFMDMKLLDSLIITSDGYESII